MSKKTLLSIQKLHKLGKIYWVESYPTLRRWVMMDFERDNILGTKVIKNQGHGNRYFIPEENVDKFIEAFEEGRLKS